MKRMLLLLCALIFAVPAWAADKAGEPAANPSAATAQSSKETPKKTHKKKKKAKSAATKSVTTTCPTACKSMNCPPPGGTIRLCCPLAPYTQTCP